MLEVTQLFREWLITTPVDTTYTYLCTVPFGKFVLIIKISVRLCINLIFLKYKLITIAT